MSSEGTGLDNKSSEFGGADNAKPEGIRLKRNTRHRSSRQQDKKTMILGSDSALNTENVPAADTGLDLGDVAPKAERTKRRSSSERIHVSCGDYRNNNNLLEGDPEGIKIALSNVDKYARNRGGKKRDNRVAGSRGGNSLPTGTLPTADSSHLSLIYVFESEAVRTDWIELWHFLRSMENITVAERSSENGLMRLTYRNEQTGVEASFTGYAPSPDGLEAGIEFSMAVPRPQCFAYEALPLAVRLAREFHVALLLRSADGNYVPIESFTEALLQKWTELCAVERQRRREQGEVLPTLRAEKIDVVWEHQYLLDEIQYYANRHVEGVFPEVEYVRRKRTGEVQRMCRWPALVPVVFPPVDVVMLVDVPKPLVNGRIIEATELFALGKEWIKTEQFPIAHKFYAKSQPTPEFIERLSAIKGVTMRSYESVEWGDLDDTN